MGFLISDGGEGGDHHVKAIEPGPSLNEVKARGARQREPEQGDADQPQVAERFHLVVGPWPLVIGRRPSVLSSRPERPRPTTIDPQPTTDNYFPAFSGKACTLLCFRP